MLVIKDVAFELKGEVIDYDAGTEELHIRFKEDKELTINHPNSVLVTNLRALGVNKIKTATIDLVKNRIELPELDLRK